MGFSQYQYYDDTNTLYQIPMNDTWATAIGATLASGTEPVLPPTTQSRYATFITTLSGRTLFVQVPIPTVSQLAAQIGNFVVIGSETWTSYSTTGETNTFNAFLGLQLPEFTSTTPGSVPSSGGGTVNFLRADGSWHAPLGTTYTGSSPVSLSGTTFGLNYVAPLSISSGNLTVNAFSSSQAGVVSASGGGTTNFLRADGNWAAPPGTSYSGSNPIAVSGSSISLNYSAPLDMSGSNLIVDTFSSSAAGIVPSSGGGTTNFLRADGSWAAPPAVQFLQVNLTSAQILAFHGNSGGDVLIIPAPGSGKIIRPIEFSISTSGGTAYTGGTTSQLYYGTGATIGNVCSGAIGAGVYTGASKFSASACSVYGAVAKANADNAAVYLNLGSTTQFTGGNLTAVVSVSYYILPTD